MFFMEIFVLDLINVNEVFEEFVKYVYDGVKKKEKERMFLRIVFFFLLDQLDFVQNGKKGMVNVGKIVMESQIVKKRNNKFLCCFIQSNELVI